MESCPTQAVLPLVGLAAEKVIRDRYKQQIGWPDFLGLGLGKMAGCEPGHHEPGRHENEEVSHQSNPARFRRNNRRRSVKQGQRHCGLTG
ncbi:MAG: hypothetical protein ACQESR_30400 [Planctomycetota bacterium]